MKERWDRAGPTRQYARLRTLAILATVTFIVAMSGTLVLFQIRSERAVESAILTQARTHAQEFNAVRAYVQGFSGIYVPASSEITANPHLEGIPGVAPSVITPAGRQYVLQNAPRVVRAVTDILERESGQRVRMKMAGLNPLNPDNLADAFGRKAIVELSRGREEYYAFSRKGTGRTFSYALGIPLDEKCARCHPDWVGRTKGVAAATVVQLDVTESLGYIDTSRTWTGVAIAVVLAVSVLAVTIALRRMLKPMHDAQLQIYDMARRDSLTGLMVRRIGIESLADEVARAEREEACVACAMLDLDDFKQVNDELGHGMGDMVLTAVGDAIRASLRPYDTASRVGGEEFLLVLPGACVREADEILKRVHQAIIETTSKIPNLDRMITCSAGIAVYAPPSRETAHELFMRADQALLLAKRQGKDRTLISSDTLLRAASAISQYRAGRLNPEG